MCEQTSVTDRRGREDRKANTHKDTSKHSGTDGYTEITLVHTGTRGERKGARERD